MAVYFKFKSARDYDSISMDGPLISIGTLKEKIYQSKNLGGTDSDLLVTNAQTNEEYTGAMLIPRNTSVLIRRVPGRPCMLEPEPPQGYVCHRCKVPGHFIQYCPTDGDPKYDVKRCKYPTGIPKSMLIATPEGSYALPSGAVAVLRPNEAAFEKEIEGLPSPTISAESKGEQKPPPGFEETLVPKEIADEGKAVIAPPQTRIAAKAPDVSEATHESMSVKVPAPASQVQQKKKKKKKKKTHPRMPSNDLQWKTYPQDMMPLGPSAYNNPYWNDMQAGYVAPFGGAMPYMVMSYGMSPLDMPFGGVMPQDPFGAQGYMMPVLPPQREFPRDREYGREVSSSVGDVSSMKSKSPQSENADHHHQQRSIRSSPEPPPLPPSKRKYDHHHHDCYYDYGHDHHNHHHHRSESSSKPSSETASTTMTTSNKKSKTEPRHSRGSGA